MLLFCLWSRWPLCGPHLARERAPTGVALGGCPKL